MFSGGIERDRGMKWVNLHVKDFRILLFYIFQGKTEGASVVVLYHHTEYQEQSQEQILRKRQKSYSGPILD